MNGGSQNCLVPKIVWNAFPPDEPLLVFCWEGLVLDVSCLNGITDGVLQISLRLHLVKYGPALIDAYCRREPCLVI